MFADAANNPDAFIAKIKDNVETALAARQNKSYTQAEVDAQQKVVD